MLLALHWKNLTVTSSGFKEVREFVPLPFEAVTFLVSLLVFLTTILTQLLTLYFRKDEAIMAASPKLFHLAYIGSYLWIFSLGIYQVQKVIDLNDTTYVNLCEMYTYAGNIGETLLFGSICARVWRLDRIFNHYLVQEISLRWSTCNFDFSSYTSCYIWMYAVGSD